MISSIVPPQSMIGYASYIHTALRPIHKVYPLCFIYLFHLCISQLQWPCIAHCFTLSKHPKQGLPPSLLAYLFHSYTLTQSAITRSHLQTTSTSFAPRYHYFFLSYQQLCASHFRYSLYLFQSLTQHTLRRNIISITWPSLFSIKLLSYWLFNGFQKSC